MRDRGDEVGRAIRWRAPQLIRQLSRFIARPALFRRRSLRPAWNEQLLGGVLTRHRVRRNGPIHHRDQSLFYDLSTSELVLFILRARAFLERSRIQLRTARFEFILSGAFALQ